MAKRIKLFGHKLTETIFWDIVGIIQDVHNFLFCGCVMVTYSRDLDVLSNNVMDSRNLTMVCIKKSITKRRC